MDKQKFLNPPAEYREVPLWSWNDDLDPDELRRQIALMDEGGWGGFYMHTRVGLRTQYLGKSWFECIRASIDEARKRGMGAWIYDEDRWPSGFAGGLTVAAHPEYRLQFLICKVDDRPTFVAERIATFAAREIEGQLTEIRPVAEPPFEEACDRVIQFWPQTMALGAPWFNDYAYLSLLNPDAVRAFIDSTHEVYAREVGDEFGRTVPGIFTDEPSISYIGYGVPRQPAVPWDAGLPAYFQARNGYDLLPRLPELFFDIGEYHAVRYDFWRTVTERFVESFSRQIYAWCEAHGLAATGHYMAEDTLLSQISWIGAAMPHYPYQHIPGIDKLGRSINEEAGTLLTVKQMDSVVCQLAKPRAFCESYGCGGQDFAHTGRKWIGDWLYVLGVNLNDPHIPLYSMRGERKRDYPQDVFYQQPWWPENRMIADYFARLSYILSQGQRVVDILVIHPMGSAWAVYRPGANRAVNELDQQLERLIMTLMQAQRDFHFGDELLLAPGAPCEGRIAIEEDGPRIRVGQMAYQVVIVPPGLTLAESTARLLRQFAEAGGQVLAVEPRPTLVNARPSPGPVLPGTTRAVAIEALAETLDEILPFDLRIANRPAIWAHHRREGGVECYFLANTDLDNGGPATVQLRGAGYLEIWNPENGEVRPLPSRQQDGITEVVLDFPPVGSQLLMLYPDRQPASIQPVFTRAAHVETLAGCWDLELEGPNALTLDTARVKIDARAWSEPLHILDAHAIIAAAGTGTPFSLRFEVDAAVRPDGPTYLVVESPQRFEIRINGQEIANQDCGWWTDISFRKVDISGALAAGANEIILSGVFARDSEIESIYLIGSFGVTAQRIGEENRHKGQVFDRYAARFRIATLSPTVQATRTSLNLNLTAQGLPFFAGRARLGQTVRLPAPRGPVMLELHNLRAALAHIWVNGQHTGALAWLPHQIDISAAIQPGDNRIEIVLVGTLRNLLGPHHHKGGDLNSTSPNHFRDKQRWTDDYILVPFGFDQVTLKIEEREEMNSRPIL